MQPDNQQTLEHWNLVDVESMYDKHLLNAEIELITQRIPRDAKILDAGCGEGEGTLVYSTLPGALVHAVDFSDTRLDKAAKRLQGRKNVVVRKVDFLGQHELDDDYDIVVAQRFLINLMELTLQQRVLLDLMGRLKPGGRLLMLEGSKQGTASLNELRAAWGLEPIPEKWHNRFFDDQRLVEFMKQNGYNLVEEDGLGTYFLLTRGVRPVLDDELGWDCEFNRLAATAAMKRMLGFETRFSRLKLWVFEK